jgi:hypothetical protein
MRHVLQLLADVRKPEQEPRAPVANGDRRPEQWVLRGRVSWLDHEAEHSRLGRCGTDTGISSSKLLTCPAADHSGDPNTENSTANAITDGRYYGDYIYNDWMGVWKHEASAGVYPYIVNPTQGKVPSKSSC